ncbi:MAG: HEAT repeat domain-containing protein [Cyanobacteria bacterium J06633_8]
MMSGLELEFTKLIAPVAGVVAKPLSERIQSKLNPNELEKALNVAIKSSNQLGEILFSRCEPDSIPGFLGKFFKNVVVEEFQKPFKNQGTPQIDYLIEAFKCLAQEHSKIKDFDEKYLKDWMEKFVNTFLSETNIYLRFKVAKDNYLNKLADRLSKHHFVGMRVAVNENSASERLENIFIMPDVAEEVSRSKLNQTLELDSDLLLDTSKRQVDLIKAQREKALLLREQSEKRNPFPAQKFLDSNKSKGQKLVLLGAPGSGKTTLMNYLALKIAQRKSEDLGLTQNIINENTIPIFIRIRELAQQKEIDILKYIQEYAAKNLQVTDLPNGCFKHWLEQGEVVILLDGLDEVAQENQQVKVVQHIDSFLQEFSRNRVIITSRPAGYERGYFRVDGFPHYEIQAFDDQKIKLFISQWYDSHCEDKVEASRQTKYLEAAIERQERIKLLARNPLLLTIIVLINRVGAELPRERYRLYERAVETLLTAWDAGKELNYRLPLEYLKPRDFKPLMQEIAYWIHSKGSTGDKEGGTLIDQDDLIEQLSRCIKKRKKRQNLEFYEAKEEAKSFLGYIQERAGLLDVQGRNCYAFVHKTFQEYLAAEDIDERYQNDGGFQVVLDSIRNHLHDPHWREVLLLLVAKQKSNNAAKAIRLILDSNSRYEKWLYRDLFFAADCLAEEPIDLQLSDDDPSQEILEQLVELESSNSPVIIDEISQKVYKTLYSLYETEFTDDVLQLLKNNKQSIDKARFHRYRVVLGEEKEANEELLSQLKDSDNYVRQKAVSNLFDIKNVSDEIIEQLFLLLKDTDSTVRIRVILLLYENQFVKPWYEIIEQLLPLIKDTESDVRGMAVLALAQLLNSWNRVLLSFLEDPDRNLRKRAVSVLCELENASDNIVEQLLPLLKDSDVDVCMEAESALNTAIIKSNIFAKKLLPLLKDSDSDVREMAAWELRKLKNASDKLGEKLLILLKDSKSDVPTYASGLLKVLNVSDKIIKQLFLLFKDPDSTVRSNAAEALVGLTRRIENARKLLLFEKQLLSLLKHPDSKVRSIAAGALGKLGNGSDKVIEQLLLLLQDPDSKVRSIAAGALGKLGNGSDKVIEQLLLLLQDPDSKVHSNAAEALGKLGNGSDKVIEQLLLLLQDPDSKVRSNAALTLGKLGNSSDKVIEQLLLLLQDPDSKARSNAALTLGKLGNSSDQAIEQLFLLLKDSSSDVRYNAASVLSKLRNVSDKVVEKLLLLLKNSESFMSYKTLSDLNELKNASDEVVRLLIRLEDPDSWQRKNAVWELAKSENVSGQIVEQLLILRLKDPDPDVCIEAASTLVKLGNTSDEVIEKLLKMLKNSDSYLRNNPVKVLSELGNATDKIVIAIENWLEEQQDSEYRKNGISVLWNLVVGASYNLHKIH